MYLGIDLGTTNSVAIIYNDKTNEMETVLIDGAEEIMPSVVNYLEDAVIVGNEAKSGAIIYPESTILSVKRHMGQETPIPLGEVEKLPEQISAEILRKLKEEAEDMAKMVFDEVVITHPAYFNDRQVYATLQAGYLAGFNTVFLLSEPLAAAIEYGYKNPQMQTLLVFDLGGGTFDASVLKVNTDEQGQETFQELSSVGDMNLGGDDFDGELIQHFKKAFKEQHKLDIDSLENNLERKRLIQKLRFEAESVKKKLSTANQVNVNISPLLIYDGIPLNLTLEVTKDEFESLIRKYVERTVDIIEEALNRAERTVDQISKVVLVGGSTLVPMVKRAVAGLKEPYRSLDPAKSVAMGAAIYNYLIHLPGSNVKVRQITRQILGTMAIIDTETMERELIPIIPMGSPIPIKISDNRFTNMSGSSSVSVNVYQWEKGYENKREYIGTIVVKGLTGSTQIELTYAIDENNLFEVYVKDLNNNTIQRALFDRTAIEEEPDFETMTEAPKNVNVVFLIDTTGSMDTYITGVQDRAIEFSNILNSKGVDFNLGLIGFGDLYEKEKPSVYSFTTDVALFQKQVKNIPRTYGGDIPESSLDALETGLALAATKTGGANIFILITDAPPHVPTKSGRSVEDMCDMLERAKVTTYVVARRDPESLAAFEPLVRSTGKYYSMNEKFYDILDSIAKSITELVRI